MQTTAKERLMIFIESMKISTREFERLSNWPNGYINHLKKVHSISYQPLMCNITPPCVAQCRARFTAVLRV